MVRYCCRPPTSVCPHEAQEEGLLVSVVIRGITLSSDPLPAGLIGADNSRVGGGSACGPPSALWVSRLAGLLTPAGAAGADQTHDAAHAAQEVAAAAVPPQSGSPRRCSVSLEVTVTALSNRICYLTAPCSSSTWRNPPRYIHFQIYAQSPWWPFPSGLIWPTSALLFTTISLLDTSRTHPSFTV